MTLAELRAKIETIERELAAQRATGDHSKAALLTRELKKLLTLTQKKESLARLTREHEALIADRSRENDEALKRLIDDEVEKLAREIKTFAKEIEEIENPADPNDDRNVIMEIRAGTGGDESALFAAQLFRMYARFAERNHWQCQIISSNRTGLGGYKEVIAEIQGEGAFRALKFESGVHRVQRVPETEKAGRVHTSAATVAVLPEAEEVDIDIKPSELRIDTYMAGGHGGQSVNTTYSAVRITHLPSGMVVTCQDERSQQQNRLKAMTILRSRLLAAEEERRMKERADARKNQVGTGDRSEKIRTYNFPQDRLTDHRIKMNIHNIAPVMDGGLDGLIAALHKASREQSNA